MKFAWPVLLVLFRALYFVYSLWCLLFPLVAVWFVIVLVRNESLLGQPTRQWAQALLVALLLFSAWVLALVFVRRLPDDPNPFQSAFLSWFGTLRGFWIAQPGDRVQLKLPSGYLVENPPAYRIRGREIQQVLHAIKPGDILLRGYDGYVDGIMIRHASVCSHKNFRPGWFTHAAIYMGELDAQDQHQVPAPYQHNTDYFQKGPHMVIHAMAKGVHSQDLLTFCRSDYLAVLRIKPDLKDLDMEAAVTHARQAALKKIGDSYDFDASDTKRFHRFSCSQLVYYCLHPIHDLLKIAPLLHAIYPLSPFNKKLAIFKRVTIIPDDFYALVQQGSMDCIWQDPISARQNGADAATT